MKARPQTVPSMTAQSSITQDSAMFAEGFDEYISILNRLPVAIPITAAQRGRNRSKNESSANPRNSHIPKESNPINAPQTIITPPLPVNPTTYWTTPIINTAMIVVRMRAFIRFSTKQLRRIF
jgi:hypothetical protein